MDNIIKKVIRNKKTNEYGYEGIYPIIGNLDYSVYEKNSIKEDELFFGEPSIVNDEFYFASKVKPVILIRIVTNALINEFIAGKLIAKEAFKVRGVDWFIIGGTGTGVYIESDKMNIRYSIGTIRNPIKNIKTKKYSISQDETFMLKYKVGGKVSEFEFINRDTCEKLLKKSKGAEEKSQNDESTADVEAEKILNKDITELSLKIKDLEKSKTFNADLIKKLVENYLDSIEDTKSAFSKGTKKLKKPDTVWTLYDIVSNIKYSLDFVTKNLQRVIANLLYASYESNVSLFLIGPMGEVLADVLAHNIDGSDADRLDCNLPYDPIALNKIKESENEVLLVQNIIGSEWFNVINDINNLQSKKIIYTHPFKEDMLLIPHSLSQFVVPILTEVFIKEINQKNVKFSRQIIKADNFEKEDYKKIQIPSKRENEYRKVMRKKEIIWNNWSKLVREFKYADDKEKIFEILLDSYLYVTENELEGL